jgi:hypothetical protein
MAMGVIGFSREGPMSISHVDGHRTGRPKGSRTTPAWVRALNWAERNYGTPDAVPPNALAAKLLQLVQDRPELFVRCLALRDAPQREAQVLRETARAENGTPTVRGLRVQRSRTDPWDRLPGGLVWLEVMHSDPMRLLRGQIALDGVPPDFEIVAGYVGGRGLLLLIRSDALPRVERGQPIPLEPAQWERLGITVAGRRV